MKAAIIIERMKKYEEVRCELPTMVGSNETAAWVDRETKKIETRRWFKNKVGSITIFVR